MLTFHKVSLQYVIIPQKGLCACMIQYIWLAIGPLTIGAMLSFNAERTLCFCGFANDLKTALLGFILIFRKEIFRMKRPIKCLLNDLYYIFGF